MKKRLEEIKIKQGVEISYEEIKEEVKVILEKKFGNISKFAYSEEGLKLCEVLGIRSEYVKMYLTPKGPKSFKMMQYLYNLLDLGNLEQNVTVVKTTNYYKV